MAAPRRGPRWPTNRGKCGFDNRSDTWPKLNVVSSSPWSSQSNFEPHVSFANNIAINGRCAPRYLRGASRFGPNGLKMLKETTHVIVRWTRVVLKK